MNKLVTVRLSGDCVQGFDVSMTIGIEGEIPNEEVVGKLPPNSAIFQKYQLWKARYRSLDLRARAKQKSGIKNVSKKEFESQNYACDSAATETCTSFNTWLKAESFRAIREAFIRNVEPSKQTRVVIRSNYRPIYYLSWNQWDLIEKNKNIEVVISNPEFKEKEKTNTPMTRGKVRILAISGDSTGIDIKRDQQLLEQLPNAEVIHLIEPQRREINDELWEQEWDILFFAGHSNTEYETGVVHINQQESLQISDLEYALQKAVDRGLQLAIFNSCDGLGLLWELEKLQIPQLIVMREPIPDLAANAFLHYFLSALVRETPVYLAVKEARQRLYSAGFDKRYPGVSALPTIHQNVASVTLTWQELGWRPTVICPYRGLFNFEEKHAPFFFGREGFTEQLLEAVEQEALVTVLGPSGSGKSSVVFAGVIPRLRTSENWVILSCRPSDKPFYALSSVLIRHLEPHLKERNDQLRATRKLAEDLQESPDVLRDVAEQIVWDKPGNRLLLIIDQFEELYTLCSKEESRQFIDCLLKEIVNVNHFRSTNHKQPHFTLLITLRADFLGHALSSSVFAQVISAADQMLGPMNREELEEAIIQPATLFKVNIESGLTRRILDDILDSDRSEAGELPLLQFTLTQLWRMQDSARLTHAAYEKIGGVRSSLARHADQVYEQLNEEAKERVRRIFIQLVHPGKQGEADTRRVITRKSIGEHNWDLITHLADVRLVTTDNNLGIGLNGKLVEEETVEIVHEALIQEWFYLRTWLDIDREFRTWQDGLRLAIRQWAEGRQDESYLLREGLSLTTAEKWFDERPLELDTDERIFIEKSIELRDRENRKRNRRRKYTILGLSIGLVSVSIFAGVAVWFREAAIASLENQISALSSSSNVLRSSDREFDALLSALRAGYPVFSQQLQIQPKTKEQVLEALRSGILEVREFNRLEGHSDEVWAVRFSPDSKKIATISSDRTLILWSPDGEKLRTIRGHRDAILSVNFSPDSQTVTTVGKDKLIKLWDIDGNEINSFTGHEDWIYDVSFSPDGQSIATVSKDNTLKLWDQSGKLLEMFEIEPADNSDGGLNSVSFSSDGKAIVASSWDKTFRLWNLENKEEQIFEGHEDAVNSVSFTPDAKSIISASSDGTIKIWSLNGQVLKTLRGHTAEVMRAIVSPDGETIVSTSFDKTIRFWNLDGDELKPYLTGHTAPIQNIAFSPDGETIASASFDHTARLWKAEFQTRQVLATHTGNIWGTAFSPDGEVLATASSDKTVKFWNRIGQNLLTLRGHKQGVTSVSFSPNSQILATASKDKTIKIWNRNGQEISTLNGHTALIDTVRFSPDGQTIATADWQGFVKLWDLDGNELVSFQAHFNLNGDNSRVYDIDFSPVSNLLVTAGRERLVKIWDYEGNLIKTLEGHTDQAYSSKFSPDGQMIATSSRDGTVRLWTLKGELVKVIEVTSGQVYDVQFSPDSKTIATSTWDGLIKLWSLDGELLKTFTGHQEEVDNISFSPDGTVLASGSRDDSVILWKLDPAKVEYTQNLWKLNLKELLDVSCEGIGGYLNYNPNIESGDRALCK